MHLWWFGSGWLKCLLPLCITSWKVRSMIQRPSHWKFQGLVQMNKFPFGAKKTPKFQGAEIAVSFNYWLVVSAHLKNISQIGLFPQIGVKIKIYLKPPPRLVYCFHLESTIHPNAGSLPMESIMIRHQFKQIHLPECCHKWWSSMGSRGISNGDLWYFRYAKMCFSNPMSS